MTSNDPTVLCNVLLESVLPNHDYIPSFLACMVEFLCVLSFAADRGSHSASLSDLQAGTS